jgi:hypothetical protein
VCEGDPVYVHFAEAIEQLVGKGGGKVNAHAGDGSTFLCL